MAESPEDTHAAGGGGGPDGGTPAADAQPAAQGAGSTEGAAPDGKPAAGGQAQEDTTDWQKRYADQTQFLSESRAALKTATGERDTLTEKIGTLESERDRYKQAFGELAPEGQPQWPQQPGQAGQPPTDPMMQMIATQIEEAQIQGGPLHAWKVAEYLQDRYKVQLLPRTGPQQPGVTADQFDERARQVYAEEMAKNAKAVEDWYESHDLECEAAREEYGRDFLDQKVKVGDREVTLERALERECREKGVSVQAALLDIGAPLIKEQLYAQALARAQADIAAAAASGQISQPGAVGSTPLPEPTDVMKETLKQAGIPTDRPEVPYVK